MDKKESGLRFRKKGESKWLELTSMSLPERGAVYEVKAPDGSVTLLSRSEAAPGLPAETVPETEPFNIDFGEGEPEGSPGLPAEIPVLSLSDLGKAPSERKVHRRVVRPGDVHDPACFAVLIEDGSTEPRYSRGQVVIVDTTKAPAEGEFGVVGLDSGECLLRRLHALKGGKIQLFALDLKFRRLDLRSEQILFAYKIVWAKE